MSEDTPVTPPANGTPPRVKKPTPWTLQKQPKVKNGSPEQRKRGEIERRRLGVRIDPDIPEGSWKWSNFPASVLDPGKTLEEHAEQLIQMLLQMADETTNARLKKEIAFDLLRLSSVGRTRVDISAQLAKAEVPDLSMLSGDQLIEIIKLSQSKTGPITIELPEKTETAE